MGADQDRDRCEELRFPVERVVVTADAAFGLYTEIKRMVSKTSPDPRPHRWAVNLVSEKREKISGFIDAITSGLHPYRNSVQLEGICNEIRREPEFDYHITKRALERVVGEPVDPFCRHLDVFEFVQKLNEYDLVITMRMHGLILCSMAGIPCLPIVREKKTSLIIEELGIKVSYDINDPAEAFSKALHCVARNPSAGMVDREILRMLEDRAMGNCDVLRRWFDGGFETRGTSIFEKIRLILGLLWRVFAARLRTWAGSADRGLVNG